MIHLDTHVLVWLYAGDVARLSQAATAAIEGNSLFTSPMALLELDFLREVGRLRVGSEEVAADLAARIGLKVSDAPFVDVARLASGLAWTRDPFDRLVVAQSLADGCGLLTKDATIREHYGAALW